MMIIVFIADRPPIGNLYLAQEQVRSSRSLSARPTAHILRTRTCASRQGRLELAEQAQAGLALRRSKAG